MNFTSLTYLGFLGSVALFYRVCPARFRAALLLIASYLFYWTWSGWMALLLLSATGLAFFAALSLETGVGETKRKQAVMLTAVALFSAVVVLFKAAPLLPDLLHRTPIVPIGLSYYTFKLIGYVLDVYWGKMPAERNFVHFAAFVAFFPQIVAGPIQRAESFLPQMHAVSPARFGHIAMGVQRILLGLFKKFVVADNLMTLVDFIYGHVYSRNTPLILGFYAYPVQVYADFSGLSDIAIGSALMFGIVTPENFNAPFAAATPSEFWRRWHITLTTWLTDYVFAPLRMSTRNWGDAGLVFSLFVNMVLIGLWHGFRLTFAVFGAIHALYLSIDALTARARKKYYKTRPAAGRVADWLGPLVTFHAIAIAFVFFRGADLNSILYFLSHLREGIGSPSAEFQTFLRVSGRSIAVGFAGYVLMEAADWFRRHDREGQLTASLPRWGRWSLYSCTAVTAIFVVWLLLAGAGTRSPFLYAIF